ncbi:MAG: glutamate--cysteine ligase [Saprospiraceae bacterium]|jgi:glutamate--cysteine ligase
MSALNKNLEKVIDLGLDSLFNQINRGLEKESLRVDTDGAMAQTPHPTTLGAALTHPSITTDFAEAQLEFVTPVSQDIDSLTNFLTEAHHFTYQNIGDEKLWASSMPCIIKEGAPIPIARFGSSNIAKMKETYRLGLGHRYGQLMQTISGIHYNFSLPKEFWPFYLGIADGPELQDAISAEYLKLIRNFHRSSWIILYLFGASPAVCKTFLNDREHSLDEYAGSSFYAPYGTSLRMSNLGYSNDAQSSIKACYNQLSTFTESLVEAMHTPHAEYEEIGVKVNGEYQQLNANLLQIENEFYAAIRPKRVADSGEKPSEALSSRGVEYIEVRSVDLNPYVPIGIDQETIIFLDMYLLYCLFNDSPLLDDKDLAENHQNKVDTVMVGRKPGLNLSRDGQSISLKQWSTEIIEEMRPIARILDSIHFTRRYGQVLDSQLESIEDPSKTLSGRILQDMQSNYSSFYEFAIAKSEEHETFFKHLRLNESARTNFANLAKSSLADQAEIEANDTVDFDAFLEDYFKV